jgi:hypothetical protein
MLLREGPEFEENSTARKRAGRFAIEGRYSRALVVDTRQHVIEDKWRRGRRVAAAASREDTHIGSADAGTIAL